MRPAYRLTPVLAVALLLLCSAESRAQGITVPKVRDSNVGYIDPAIPGNVFRFRYDAAFDNPSPTRATFFWAPGGKFGPGPDFPETSVNYQDLISYAEVLLADNTSVFAELPVRLLDPELNPNQAGLGDSNFGFKHALVAQEDLIASFQFRTYVPTGDYHHGIGNGHVSLEPALLLYRPIGDCWGLEAELRDWIPLTGNDFAGNIVRYGLGLRYNLYCDEDMMVTPVAEFVGWTILDGKVAERQSAALVTAADAAGQTIVNAKLGLRTRVGDNVDFYLGYGTPLSNEIWYQNNFRFELRYLY